MCRLQFQVGGSGDRTEVWMSLLQKTRKWMNRTCNDGVQGLQDY